MVIISQITPPIVKHIIVLLINQTGEIKKNLKYLIKVPLLNIMEYAVTITAVIRTSDHQFSYVK